MIEIRAKKNCCGCNACGDICPKGAISFSPDDEGFLYPQVNRTLCVQCGRCVDVCPMVRVDDFRNRGFDRPRSYAVAHKNLAIRFDSTSGGAFSALAKVVYGRKGFVGGAVRKDDFSVANFISDKRIDLSRLRSSKYEQSDARGFYSSVKDALETGRPVLVCGTPCQMVALRAFLGKDWPNLYILDFVCRGNNSPLAARKFREWLEGNAGSRIVYFKQKNKELGWDKLTNKVVYANGRVEYWTRDNSPFNYCYLKTNAFCRPSCYDCKFKHIPRFADITLADCWGCEKEFKDELAANIGTSLVLVNNVHGEELFDEARASFHLQELDWDVARAGNPAIDKSLPPSAYPREDVFHILSKDGFQGLIDKYLCSPSESTKKVSLFRSSGRRIKFLYRRWRFIYRWGGWSLPFYFRLIKVNGFTNIIKGKKLLVLINGTQFLNSGGRVELGKCDNRIGDGQLPKAPEGTYIVLRKDAVLKFEGYGHFTYGAAIEVHDNAHLEIGDGSGFNIGATIICGERITIGKYVMGGRNVTIRDTNGGHWMNLPGYKNTKPVVIGDHVWLCEGCTIMPGVKIGAGAVIGAKAVVFNDVPANTLVVGNPAKVVCDHVEWKY